MITFDTKLDTIGDIVKPLEEYVQKQVDYYSRMGLKTGIEVGKESAYNDILGKIKKLKFNGKVE